MSKGENNYLSLQKIYKGINYFKIDIKGISGQLETFRNVQRYCSSINPYLSAYRKFYSMLH